MNPEYAQRIDRVIDYLRENLHRPVKLAELARVACFSEFHFHRIFGAVCGFSASATFSRAFRAGYATSPSEFRKSGGEIKNSKIRKELFDPQEYHLPMSAAEKSAAFPVRLIDLPERRGAYIRVTNTSEQSRVIGAFQTMIEWAKSQHVFSEGTLFGMSVDDPHVTPRLAARDTKWFSPSESSFMINYRVDDLSALIAQLEKSGVNILQGPESRENGKFAWLMDPDGNKIELWEPAIS